MKRPQLGELTLREKIGQTVCVRENLMARIPDLVEHLKKYPYGCMWAMGNQLNDNENMSEGTDKSGKATGKAYRETAKQLMAATRVPILMAGNTESGFSSVFPELSHNMGQMAVAATDDEELIYEQAAAIAREMRASGVQWKWSPNVDTDKMCSTGIGGRSYSDDIERLIRYSVACVRGTQSEGVAVTVKHFPGKDNIEYRDSHVAPAVNRQSRAWWDKTNGYIYRELFKRAEPWGIMPGHQGLPCVDDRRMSDGNFIPTTLSHKIITGLLKGELGYKGVVITDAIGMAALATLMPENDLYVELLLAGNDMILGPTEQATDNYIDVVEQAVLDGRIPESRIDDACRRVLNMKEKMGMFRDDFGLDIEITLELTAKTREIEHKLAQKAITLVRGEDRLPLQADKIKKVLLAPVAYWEEFNEDIRYTGQLLEQRGIQVDYAYPEQLETWKLSKDQDWSKYDMILMGTYLRGQRPAGVNGFNHHHHRFMQFFQTRCNDRIVGVAYGSPHVYYNNFSSMGKAFICAYDYTKELQEATVAALFGEIPFRGKCPFRLVPKEALLDIIEEPQD